MCSNIWYDCSVELSVLENVFYDNNCNSTKYLEILSVNSSHKTRRISSKLKKYLELL